MKKNAKINHENIRGILFDLDGVIVDSMPCHARAWIDALQELNLVIDEVDIYKREGMTGIASVRDIFIEKSESVPSDEELELLIKRKIALFEKYTVDIFPESIELLSFFKKNNKQLALVTGSNRRAVNYMLNEDIQELFDCIVTADDVTNGKPNPEPYLKGIEKLELDQSNVIVVENAPMGIKSAKAASLFCVAIETTLSHEYLTEVDVVFRTHSDVLSYFSKKYNYITL